MTTQPGRALDRVGSRSLSALSGTAAPPGGHAALHSCFGGSRLVRGGSPGSSGESRRETRARRGVGRLFPKGFAPPPGLQHIVAYSFL